MVIAVVRKKTERSPVRGEREAKRFVECLRDIEIGDGEVHVAEARRGREFERISILGWGGKCGEFIEIEWESGHVDAVAGPLPGFARTIGVDFDAVVLGIGKVESFADQMIGGADEIPLVARGMAKETAESGAIGNQNREMEKSGGEWRAWLEIRNGSKREVETAASGKGGGIVRMGRHCEAEVFVEI